MWMCACGALRSKPRVCCWKGKEVVELGVEAKCRSLSHADVSALLSRSLVLCRATARHSAAHRILRVGDHVEGMRRRRRGVTRTHGKRGGCQRAAPSRR